MINLRHRISSALAGTLWCFAVAAALTLGAGFVRAEMTPDLVVTLGNNARGGLVAGEPLVVHVWVNAPDVPANEPLRIPTGKKHWTDAISFVVRDASNHELTATPAVAKPADSGTILLSTRQRASATFRWSMAQTQVLAPGQYLIGARLRYGYAPNVRTIVATPVPLEVRPWPDNPAPDESARHDIALAQGWVDEQNLDRAAALLNEVLSRNPDHDRALVLRAHVEEQQGNLVAALADVSHALQQLDKAGPGRPPLALIQYQLHLMNRLLGNDDPSATEAVTSSATSAATTASASTSQPRSPANSHPPPNTIVIKPAGTSFAGVWSTPFGKVMISEFDGKFVTYNHDKLGMVQGTVDGDTARGTWKQANGSGQVLLKLSADKKSFSGVYTNGNEEPVLGQSPAWDGTRAH